MASDCETEEEDNLTQDPCEIESLEAGDPPEIESNVHHSSNLKIKGNVIGLPWVENCENIEYSNLSDQEKLSNKKSKKPEFIWYDHPPKESQTRACDSYSQKPGLTSYSKDAQSAYDFYKLFLDETAVNLILEYTNQKLPEYKESDDYKRSVSDKNR